MNKNVKISTETNARLGLHFSSKVKGQITQSLVKVLFERAGYRVMRLGIEEMFSEIVHLDKDQYFQLGLPDQLRYLPDLLIASPEITTASLVEVKFRSVFNQETASDLYRVLSRQFNYWPSALCVLLIGESCLEDGRFHQDYIRVVDQDHLIHLNSSYWPGYSETDQRTEPQLCEIQSSYECFGYRGVWELLPALYDAFERFHYTKTDTWAYADMITMTLRDLKKL